MPFRGRQPAQGRRDQRRPDRRGAHAPRPALTAALVLMYHRVFRPEVDPWRLCATPERFAEHVQVLKKEPTGILWRPVYNLLEGRFELSPVNAQHVKMVPGRKSDVRDSEWLTRLLELGLLRRSFVPPAAQRELRDVVRYRKRLIEERAREANRIQKVLETANLK